MPPPPTRADLVRSNARAAEVARHSFGKLVAILAAKTRDVAEAEDLLSLAFQRALTSWPSDGIPHQPEAWLVRVAHNAMIDRRRSAAERRRDPMSLTEEALTHLEAETNGEHGDALVPSVPDRRVDLLFACAHPGIDESVRTPLMLQVVLGIEVKTIATLYAMPTATLAQRLVRAKRKIKAAGIPFRVPDSAVDDAELGPVLEAIYGAYALDWTALDAGVADDLRGEALYLANLVNHRLNVPEAHALEALLAFLSARHAARFDASGHLVPLAEQDPAHWDPTLLRHGYALMHRVAEAGGSGRFQYEAAIQSLHVARRFGAATDWPGIVRLYEGLLTVAPTMGAAVAHAAAVAEAFGPSRGLAALEAIEPQDVLLRFQPYWATKAHLLRHVGDSRAAALAIDRAIDLCTDMPLRRHLVARRDAWGA